MDIITDWYIMFVHIGFIIGAIVAPLYIVLYILVVYSKNHYEKAYPYNNSKLVTPKNNIRAYQNKKATPPRAMFFGRINGKEYTSSGPYEEDYLSILDRIAWKAQKHKEAVRDLDSARKKGKTY